MRAEGGTGKVGEVNQTIDFSEDNINALEVEFGGYEGQFKLTMARIQVVLGGPAIQLDLILSYEDAERLFKALKSYFTPEESAEDVDGALVPVRTKMERDGSELFPSR